MKSIGKSVEFIGQVINLLLGSNIATGSAQLAKNDPYSIFY